uniref:Uncharacterized protein n=1 Tax=Anguilla anguilla TaxID=7936 RepID=A0A0E9RT54_ANGAN
MESIAVDCIWRQGVVREMDKPTVVFLLNALLATEPLSN